MNESLVPPYPSDTRARGWRFELDHERIAQSSTWALAGADGRPWLLMMWMTAWQQCPCGSLPADEEVIYALIGCPPKTWAKLRKALLRGWSEAEDGRLYHPTITERALDMVQQRGKTAKRVAEYKLKAREQREGNALPTSEQQSKNGTGTGTGTSIKNQRENHPDAGGRAGQGADDDFDAVPLVGGLDPTPAGSVCMAMRQAGIADTNPGHPRLLALLQAGATKAEFVGFAPAAIAKGAGFAWILGAVEGERTRAASTNPGLHRGPITTKSVARVASNIEVAKLFLERSAK